MRSRPNPHGEEPARAVHRRRLVRRHRHGATPDDFMKHLAMFENSDDLAGTTSWGQHVSDEEYDPNPQQ